MSDYLDPDHWVNGGEYMWYPHPDALAMEALEALEAENKQLRAEVEQLRQALHDARIENSGQAAELERIHAKRRWIPIKERLPEQNIEVLVVWGSVHNPDIAWMIDDSNWESITGLPISKITHWMPLPQAPREEVL